MPKDPIRVTTVQEAEKDGFLTYVEAVSWATDTYGRMANGNDTEICIEGKWEDLPIDGAEGAETQRLRWSASVYGVRRQEQK